jgi:diguanylate cyclase (GGDEF)-like protein
MKGTYDLALLIASCGVASAAAYVALGLGARIAALDSERARYWLLGGGVALGTGLWAMHIISLTALDLPIVVSYDLGYTALSWLCGAGVGTLALHLVSRNTLRPATLAGGALLTGTGLSLMHFSGLWAMRLSPQLEYDPQLLAAAVAVAALASCALLFICYSARQMEGAQALPLRVAAALVVGVLLCATQYTDSTAVRFPHEALCAAGNLLGGSWMGQPLALIVGGLLFAVQLLSHMDAQADQQRNRSARQRSELERMRRMAYYDTVTGLPNRSLFNETLLRQLISVNGNAPQPFGVVYAELRDYRVLVDTLGQDRINQVLKSLTTQLSQSLRPGDMLARLSHDGFICLLHEHADCSIETGTAQLGARFNMPMQFESQTYRLAWGIGASSYPDSGNSTQALVRAAMRLQREVGVVAAPASRKEAVTALGAA